MKRFYLIILFFVALSLVFIWVEYNSWRQEQKWEKPPLEIMNIAKNSQECTDVGPFSGANIYDQNSKTWWVGIEYEGCFVDCVVDEETKKSVVNWRCFGAN